LAVLRNDANLCLTVDDAQMRKICENSINGPGMLKYARFALVIAGLLLFWLVYLMVAKSWLRKRGK
jgi:hypothetical protein